MGTVARWALTCDPGIDDAIALAVAAGHPGIELTGVVAGAGNVAAPTAWRNAAGMAAMLGLGGRVAVGIGGTTRLDGTPLTRAASSHGPDGLGGLAHRLPSVDDPPTDGADLVRDRVVATGPPTDVARTLLAGVPIDEVVWMGGSTALATGVDAVGAEFNAAADPTAADVVLGSGAEVRVVPIEITLQVPFVAADVDPWTSGGPAARFCADLVGRRAAGCAQALLHDPVAVVAAADPGLFRWERHALRCQADGAVVAAPAGGTVALAVAVDVAAVRHAIVDSVVGAGSAGG